MLDHPYVLHTSLRREEVQREKGIDKQRGREKEREIQEKSMARTTWWTGAGRYLAFSPLPTHWPWTFLASNDQRKSALWSNTHFSLFLNQALRCLWKTLTDLHLTTSEFIWVVINDNCITTIYHYCKLMPNTKRSGMYIVFILTVELLHNSEKKSKAVVGVGLGVLQPPSLSQK